MGNSSKPEWFKSLIEVLEWHAEPKQVQRRPLHRRFHFSSDVLAYVRSCDEAEKIAFADLVLRLDANPVRDSVPLLTSIGPPGMRWARFADHIALFQWDPAADAVRFALCEPADS